MQFPRLCKPESGRRWGLANNNLLVAAGPGNTKMTIAINTRPAPFGSITFLRMINATERPIVAFGAWNRARKTVAALSALSDRELHDIGLSRGEIRGVAANA